MFFFGNNTFQIKEAPQFYFARWYGVVQSCACSLWLLVEPFRCFLVIQMTSLYVCTSGLIQTSIDDFTAIVLQTVTGEGTGGRQLLGGGYCSPVRTSVRRVFPRANVSIPRYAYSL